MTEEDEEFERIASRCRETQLAKEARWQDHTKDCPNCARMREDINVLMKRLERLLSEKR